MKAFKKGKPKDATMAVGQYALHGDVIITRVDMLPENFAGMETEPKNALAYGELTGHVHQLCGEPGVDFDLRVSPAGERHLKIVQPTMLRHQEHDPILLKPGNYQIGIQREFDPFEKLIRSVQD